MFLKRRLLSFALVSCLASAEILAGVTPAGTRLIMLEGQREASLLLSNQNIYPVITQLWVDDGALNNQPDKTRSAFMVLPPIFHLDSKEITSVRVIATGQQQPADRESLYWLNIYEVPPSPDESNAQPATHKMLLTMRKQMKLIYRPKALRATADSAAKKVQFSYESGRLIVRNPTPHYITISSILLHHPNTERLKQAPMLEPFGQTYVELEDSQPIHKISFIWLDDDGLQRNQNVALRAPLTAEQQFSQRP